MYEVPNRRHPHSWGLESTGTWISNVIWRRVRALAAEEEADGNGTGRAVAWSVPSQPNAISAPQT